eukprot:14134-Chlamydomonas_euryale.AAC.1
MAGALLGTVRGMRAVWGGAVQWLVSMALPARKSCKETHAPSPTYLTQATYIQLIYSYDGSI